MPETLIQPPRTLLEVWEGLPEGTLCQIINDKLIMSPAPIIAHQMILNKINIALSIFLIKKPLGEILISPVDVRFSKQNILQPDILFIKNENLDRIKKNNVFGAPDIVIEILSPSTSHYDLEEKKLVYERHGVQEYFIVEPNAKSVMTYFLKDGIYEQQKSRNGRIKSAILNTEILF